MEDAASVLLGFPPSEPLSSDKAYNDAINLHIKNVDHLLAQTKAVTSDNAVKFLQVLNPAVNSLSYLAILDLFIQDVNAASPEQRATAIISFYTSFDPRQIRYAGQMFTSCLKTMISGTFPLPHDVKVGLLTNAILKIDPTGSMLTSLHLDLVQLAYDTDTAEYAFPVLLKHIVYYPGMDNDSNGNRNSNTLAQKLLCDMTLSPPDYISQETGFTSALDVQGVLEYDYVSGLLFLTRSQWKQARAAFERAITHPTRDGGVSSILTEAYNKWLLTSLLVNGRTPGMPSNAGSNAKKTFEITGKPYQALASHFDAMTAVDLKREVDAHPEVWRQDRNTGLVQEVLAAHQKWQIMNLRNVFSKVSLSQIRTTTYSAETGQALPTDEDVEKLVQGMIDGGMLKGVIEKPDGKPAYLKYLAEAEEFSEVEYNRELAGVMKRLKELEAIYRTTNARLSTNPYWLKHVIREQKREKDNSASGALPQGFDAQVDEEDLMTGVMPGGL